MTIYYGSDIHLGHNNILSFCKRPFKDLEEMRASFIGECYSLLTDEDDVYLLGDIAFNKVKESLDLLLDCPGNFYLIIGNHDSKTVIKHPLWKDTFYLKDVKDPEADLPVTICHYPIEHWDKRRYGSIHLHGHTHGNISREVSDIPNRFDVGYDATNKWLATLPQIVTKYRQIEVEKRLLTLRQD